MFKAIALVGIKLYQIFLSPILPRSCRFYPSCSQYCYQSIEKYGIFKGTFKTIYRLLKCNPWNKGGINLP